MSITPDRPNNARQVIAWSPSITSTLTVSSATTGNTIWVGDYIRKTFFFTDGGISANNSTIDISPDGTFWMAALSGTAQTSATSAMISTYCNYIRYNVRTYSSGSPTVILNAYAA